MTQVDAGGLVIETRAPTSSFAGVEIQFHPGIPSYMRGMVLESALRHWQRNVGMVRRGAVADVPAGRLPGWKIMKDGKPVRVLRLAYKEDTLT